MLKIEVCGFASAQASTNTVLAHFASIVFANWMLRLLQRAQQNAAPA